jgi:hypothetical protein
MKDPTWLEEAKEYFCIKPKCVAARRDLHRLLGMLN